MPLDASLNDSDIDGSSFAESLSGRESPAESSFDGSEEEDGLDEELAFILRDGSKEIREVAAKEKRAATAAKAKTAAAAKAKTAVKAKTAATAATKAAADTATNTTGNPDTANAAVNRTRCVRYIILNAPD